MIYVCGANGFVGSNIVKGLSEIGHETVGLGRNDVDFSDPVSVSRMNRIIKKNSVVVLAFAKAPAKNADDLFANVYMLRNAIKSLESLDPLYILNLSSDAIFSDSMDKLNEQSLVAPMNFHGIMHALRENALNRHFGNKVGHLRPTLIFGADDPHNGYGPNSFLRKSREKEEIVLFGNGEEQRDHIYIDDVVSIAVKMINSRLASGLNAVTGTLTTFYEIAEKTQTLFNPGGKLLHTPRSVPMPHNGYRAFDNSRLIAFMPELQCLSVLDYLQREFDASI